MSTDDGLDASLLAGRFRLGDKLGAGAFGEVYDAHDRTSGRHVALKILRRLDARSLYRFKREFRALAELSHPNLVRLHELFAADDLWFFTMERVPGVSFLERLRPPTLRAHDSTAGTLSLSAEPAAPAADPSGCAATQPPAGTRPIDLDEVRRLLRDLVTGVAALHRAGKVHRDLKPSNVLVTPEGRVVILDFGLVTEVRGDVASDSTDRRAGTPAYMAPEQAAGRAVSTSADWYAVGAMLFEVLTGRLPFGGRPGQMMNDKQLRDGPDPRTIDADLPRDLAELCRDLLRVAPARRPGAAVLFDRLGPASVNPLVERAPRSETWSRLDSMPFVGRSRHLAVLDAALTEAMAGHCTAVFLRGSSGMGKSAIVRRFLDDARVACSATVLEGRCFERESVPYNALDAVVDALSSELLGLDEPAIAELAPRHVAELCAVFPVLSRVPSFADDIARGTRVAELQEVRHRAISGLKDLLSGVARGRPTIVYVDDLQWGDVDSGVALTQLFDGPEAPPLLFVGSYRIDASGKGTLPSLLQASLRLYRVETIEVEALAEDDARALALAILSAERRSTSRRAAARATDDDGYDNGDDDDNGDGDHAKRAAAIAREAGGHPYFVAELARTGADGRAVGSLAAIIGARVDALPPAARAIVECVAIAGRPIPVDVALKGAGLDPSADDGVERLVASRLIRSTGLPDRVVETYHDRIRETVTGLLPAERARALHLGIGRALEAVASTPSHVLARHFVLGGARDAALRHARLAAGEASRALAFDRAAELHRVALEQVDDDDDATKVELLRGLGDSLADAGRGVEAADAYLDAARRDEPHALELERRAAAALFVAGHVDRGLEVGGAVLARVGMRLPRFARLAYLFALLRFAWFLLRGVRFRQRPEAEIDKATLLRMDTQFDVAFGLAFTDANRSMYFATRFVLMALRAGEPMRVGLAMVAAILWFSALFGPQSAAPARWQGQLELLAEQLDSARLRGAAALTAGLRSFFCGRWAEVPERCAEAERILLEVSGGAWELSWARAFHCWSLFQVGRIRELSIRAPALAEEGKRRDDFGLWCRASSGNATVAWLVRDDLAGAKRVLSEATLRWPPKQPFAVMHHWTMISRRFIHLYAGEPELLFDYIEEAWPMMQSSGLLRLRFLRSIALHVRSVANLAYAAGRPPGDERSDFLEASLSDARDVARLEIGGGEPLVALVRAGVARVRGDDDEVRQQLAVAIDRFDQARMPLHAAVARICMGRVEGGASGEALCAEGLAFMQDETIARPERFVAMLAPGFQP